MWGRKRREEGENNNEGEKEERRGREEYRRMGNVCEWLIIANCEFFPDSQSLERKKLLLPGTTCTGCAAIAIIGKAISLFSLKRKHFTTHLKPVLR